MVEVVAHGQELTTEFLDHLFVSLRDKIPKDKWVEIKKNNDQVIAGIKHIIDLDYYGYNMDIVFNSKYTHFRKTVFEKQKPYMFENHVIDKTACFRVEEMKIAEREEAQRRADRVIDKENKSSIKNEIGKRRVKRVKR